MTTGPAPSSFASSIPELLARLAEVDPGRIVSYHRVQRSAWAGTRMAELHAEVLRGARGLRQLGLERGDRLAILSPTRREWQVAELATLAAGGVVVGIDAHAPAQQAAWILEHARVTGIVVDAPERLAALPALTVKRLRLVVVLSGSDPEARPHGVASWDDVLVAGASEVALDALSADDGATVIYTSGTTGTPKGIAYDHARLLAACRSIIAEFDLHEPGHSVPCWLPMAPCSR